MQATLNSLTLPSALNSSKTVTVTPGDTVFCGMHKRTVRISRIEADGFVEVTPTDSPKPLPDLSHKAHLKGF